MIWVIQGKIPKNTIGRVLMEGGGRRNDPTNNICPEIMLFHYLILSIARTDALSFYECIIVFVMAMFQLLLVLMTPK